VTRILPAAIAAIFLTTPFAQADWPRFRGVNGSGTAEAKNLPVEFGRDKNLAWRTPLPPGHSSPVWSGDRIFVTAHEGNKLLTICVDRASGAIRWKREVTRARIEQRNPMNNPASSSPVADGTNVIAFFAEFGLLAYSGDGTERWRMPLGPFHSNNGFGSVAGAVWQQADSGRRSGYRLLCDGARQGLREILCGSATARKFLARDTRHPIVVEATDAGRILIVPGSFELAAYQLETGEKLWWVRGFPYAPKGSPTVTLDSSGAPVIVMNVQTIGDGGGRQMEPYADLIERFDANHDGKLTWSELKKHPVLSGVFPQFDFDWRRILTAEEWGAALNYNTIQNVLIAIRPGGKGDVTKSATLWSYSKMLPEVPSPMVYRGILYLIKDGGLLTTMDPVSGEIFKQARLAGCDRSLLRVAHRGRRQDLISRAWAAAWRCCAQVEPAKCSRSTNLDEETFATPAIGEDCLYVRTRAALYCFRQKPA
jgi:hypothetical protein